MSSVHHIRPDLQQAIEEHKSNDTSNTMLSLRDVDRDIQPYAMMTKTAYMEFDPMSTRAKLPACFTRDFGSFIRNYVILQDPKRNHIQISVQRKNNKIYFTNGWSRLRDFYDIGLGGWVTILYISPLLFYIRVRKLTGINVTYPEKTPPFRLMLLEQSNQGPMDGPVPYFAAPNTFCHTLEKTLTSIDIESGVLKMPWNGFCENAFPNRDAELLFVDWFGHPWKCRLEIGCCPPRTCQIYGQWRSMCKARSLVEGVTLKFGATKPSNNEIIHFKITPFIGVRTTLIAPTTTGGYKSFYQTQQFFML